MLKTKCRTPSWFQQLTKGKRCMAGRHHRIQSSKHHRWALLVSCSQHLRLVGCGITPWYAWGDFRVKAWINERSIQNWLNKKIDIIYIIILCCTAVVMNVYMTILCSTNLTTKIDNGYNIISQKVMCVVSQ